MTNIYINFYPKRLTKQKSGNNTSLIASIHFHGKRIIYYTGMEFMDHQWNKKNQCFEYRIDSDTMNEKLHLMRKKFREAFYSILQKKSRVDPGEYRLAIRGIKNLSQYSLSAGFVKFLEEKNPNWSILTYKKFKALYKKLNQFQELKGEGISLESIDGSLLQEFYNFLKSKDLKPISIASYMNLLKCFLNYSRSNSWMINDDFRSFRLPGSAQEENVGYNSLYLYKSELEKIHSSAFGSRKLQHMRDIFLLICYTGSRFSEFKELKKSDFDGKKLVFRNRGNRELVLNQKALSILESYNNRYFKNNSLLPVYSLITVNKYLKLLFSEIGINRSVNFRNKPGIPNEHLNKIATISLAYNTFMSIAVELGISPIIVRKWSGNKTLSRYNSVKASIENEETRSVEIMNDRL